MRNKIEMIKEYDAEYCNILDSIDAQYMSKRQINRKISKKWNVPYDVIQDLSKESDKLTEDINNNQ